MYKLFLKKKMRGSTIFLWIVKNSNIQHDRTKPVEIDYNLIYEKMKNKTIEVL
jgi:hypothetical protein